MIIDANNLILGRLATKVAKQALLGHKIDIVNSENTVISGKRSMVFDKYKTMDKRGTPAKGPFVPKLPDRFVRKTIKRMLPYKLPKGREAFKRVMCYIGTPEEFKDKEITTIPEASVENLGTLSYVSVKEICRQLGGKQ